MTHVALALLIATSIAAAAPALEPHTSGALGVSLPKGWKITTNDGAATIFVAQQDPAKADAAAMLVSIQTTGNTATEDQLLDVVAQQVAKDLKVARREALKGGGHVLVADGVAGAVKVRIAAVAMASGEGAVMGVLVAKTGDFDGLGGLGLVVQVMTSLKITPTAATAPAAPATAPAAPATTSKPTSVADLAGVWENTGSSTKQYANANGGYAGASSVSMYTKFTIAANGDYSEVFRAYQGGTATGGGNFSGTTYTGKFILSPNGVLEVTVKGHNSQFYIVQDWTQDADQTVLKLSGMYFSTPPAENIADPRRGNHETWYRKNVKK